MYHCYAKPIEIVPKQDTKNVPKIPIEDLTPKDIIPNVKNYDQLKKTFAIIGLRILTIKNIGLITQILRKLKKHINICFLIFKISSNSTKHNFLPHK